MYCNRLNPGIRNIILPSAGLMALATAILPVIFRKKKVVIVPRTLEVFFFFPLMCNLISGPI